MRVVVAVLVVWCAVARADDAGDKAAALSREAFAQVKDGRYASAIDLFQQAYDLTKDIRYLLNVAVAQRKAGLVHQAAQTFRRYIAEGGDKLTDDDRAQIAKEIALVEQEAAHVTVTVHGGDAEVAVDGYVIGTVTANGSLVVLVATEGGREHVIRAARAGAAEDTQTLRGLQPGEQRAVTLEPKSTGTLAITSDPTGATITRGKAGAALGLAPVSLQLAPGSYELWGRLPEREPAVHNVVVRAGETQQVTFHLRPLPTWWERNRTLVIIGSGLAVVAAGVLLAPTVNDAFAPDRGTVRHVP
ncbi:MAG: PEGA domain-containing protein [Deltaproteobacteria bacterium]|nr:PEGA domain-containing protein [Deltaproteobacteria bacterium]